MCVCVRTFNFISNVIIPFLRVRHWRPPRVCVCCVGVFLLGARSVFLVHLGTVFESYLHRFRVRQAGHLSLDAQFVRRGDLNARRNRLVGGALFLVCVHEEGLARNNNGKRGGGVDVTQCVLLFVKTREDRRSVSRWKSPSIPLDAFKLRVLVQTSHGINNGAGFYRIFLKSYFILFNFFHAKRHITELSLTSRENFRSSPPVTGPDLYRPAGGVGGFTYQKMYAVCAKETDNERADHGHGVTSVFERVGHR